jgi:hypothetical protein
MNALFDFVGYVHDIPALQQPALLEPPEGGVVLDEAAWSLHYRLRWVADVFRLSEELRQTPEEDFPQKDEEYRCLCAVLWIKCVRHWLASTWPARFRADARQVFFPLADAICAADMVREPRQTGAPVLTRACEQLAKIRDFLRFHVHRDELPHKLWASADMASEGCVKLAELLESEAASIERLDAGEGRRQHAADGQAGAEEKTATEWAEKLDVPKPEWTRATQKGEQEAGFLPHRRAGRHVFIQRQHAEHFAKNYHARREQRVVGSRSPKGAETQFQDPED